MNKTIIVTLILISIIFFCTAGTVSGKAKDAASEDALYYHQLEEAHVSRVRTVLDDRGCRNSGVSMTHLVDDSGECTYVVKMHHERLERMSREKQSELYDALTSIDFEAGEVLYEIL